MSQTATRKRTLAERLTTWFPFLGLKSVELSDNGSEPLKAPSRKKFSFKRKVSEAQRSQPESVTIDNNYTVVTFKGDDTIAIVSEITETQSPKSGPRTSLKFQDSTSLNDRASNRTSIKKRASSRLYRAISRGKSQKFEITEDMMNLQRIILDPQHRQKLIELLVPLDGDSSVKVRFCCAVEEFQREKDKKLRTKKAVHIVRMFIRKGSLFRLKDISKEHEKSLKAKKYETLESLKNVILDELVLNQVVAKTMKEILAVEPKEESDINAPDERRRSSQIENMPKETGAIKTE